MDMEFSESHGVICRSTFVDVRVPQNAYSTLIEVLMTSEVEISGDRHFVSLEKGFELMRTSSKTLLGLNTHPSDAVVVGFMLDPAHPIVLAAARTERKQRDLTERGLTVEAEAEAALTRAALARLRPLAEKARTVGVSAEEMVEVMKAERDPKVARERYLALAAGSSTVRDEQETLINPELRPLPRRFAASKPYVLNVRVTALDESPPTAKLALTDESLPDSLFWANDAGARSITTRISDPADFMLLSLCMAFKVTLQTELAIELDLAASGRTYTASMIRLADSSATRNAIRTLGKNESGDLFRDDV